MLNKYYEQFGYVGIEEPRCYYVPFAHRYEWNEDRANSSAFTSLNGTWKIDAYDSVVDVRDDFTLNTPKKEISVPSCVQYYGYDRFQYTNINYPFPFDPPFVPANNPAYHYQRTFTSRGEDRKYLVFEGVDSCFYLYVNDKFVGFSQISHRVSEFDVTDFVTDGENKVDVLVLKWCAGSYLEDQDKWRFTGIFRDVYLLTRPDEHVVDYKIEAHADGRMQFTLIKGCTADVTFAHVIKTVHEGETVEFSVSEPRLWSAEDPYLYDLDITTGGEFIREKVGFRDVKIEDGVFKVNGAPIKLRGVNRHDFHPEKGAAVSLDDIKTDLRLMKELNVNAIRTSHYPSCPEFYQLCDKYGFYVMDEADMETHGCGTTLMPGRHESYIADCPEFEYAMVERQKNLVERDKNRPSVIIWSMGNECGWGKNFYACSKWIKSHDGTRPVHYERVCQIGYNLDMEKVTNYVFPDYYTAPVDMVSRMYATPEFMRDVYLKDEKETRPFVQCEYCHAMGNSPGDFKLYWDVINSSDRFMGAFVWEWADHGVLYKSNGFRYGGDFGENLHDGNFCIDGIVTPDRKIKTGTLEMKKAYEPVVIEKNGNTVTVTSRNRFAPLDVIASVTEKELGNVISRHEQRLIIEPGDSVTLPCSDAQTVAVDLMLAEDSGLLCRGHLIAHESFAKPVDTREKLGCAAVTFLDKGRYIQAKTKEFKYMIDKATGEIASVNKNGSDILKDRISLNIWRAPIDNDRFIKNNWKKRHLHNLNQNARSVTVSGANEITVEGTLAAASFEPAVRYVLRYTFHENAVTADLDYSYRPYHGDYDKNDFLPRIGLIIPLSKKYREVKYYGYGPQESYSDKRWACDKDVFESTVDEMFEHYIKPQETGSHYGTQYMEISGGEHVIRLQNRDGFSFCASPYHHSVIERTEHDDQLPASKATYLYADYYMSGIGSNSCGTLPRLWDRTPDSGKGSITLMFK